MNKTLKILFLLVVTFSSLSIKAQESDATYEETVEWLNNNISKMEGNYVFVVKDGGIFHLIYNLIESKSNEISFKIIKKRTPVNREGGSTKSIRIYYSDIINVGVSEAIMYDKYDESYGDDSILSLYLSESRTLYYVNNISGKTTERKWNTMEFHFDSKDYHSKRVIKALKHLAYLNNQRNGEKF